VRPRKSNVLGTVRERRIVERDLHPKRPGTQGATADAAESDHAETRAQAPRGDVMQVRPPAFEIGAQRVAGRGAARRRIIAPRVGDFSSRNQERCKPRFRPGRRPEVDDVADPLRTTIRVRFRCAITAASMGIRATTMPSQLSRALPYRIEGSCAD
jgi:hypothetical protein